MTVKDSFDIAGLPTLCGSQFRLAHRADRDSTPVRRLRAAGCVIVGKTDCPEFLANYETDNHITGRTNNPWDLDYTAGGSSGGESAAIASLFSAGGIGSDGGGSIRIPAHFTGIVGLKPTPGRVPATGHFPEISHPGGLLGVAGPMARTVGDTRLLFNVLAGYDDQDPFSSPVPLRAPLVQNLRVGLVHSVCGVPVEPAVQKALERAAACLESLRITVEPVELVGLEPAPALWWFFFAELAALYIREAIAGREKDAHWTGTELVNMSDPERKITGREVVEKLAARDRIRAVLLHQMRDYPVLLAPHCAITAFRHREREWQVHGQRLGLLEVTMPASVFNLLGLPGLVLPFEVSETGLPVGVQLVGTPFSEELLLEIGSRLEEARGSFSAPPGYDT